jgi:hypothetical protein
MIIIYGYHKLHSSSVTWESKINGELIPTDINPNNVTSLTLSSYDLLYVLDQITPGSIPTLAGTTRKETTFYGDHAKFIIANVLLPLSIKSHNEANASKEFFGYGGTR